MIIWLASYPKSGNTWIRSLLASYYYSENGEFEFKLLNKIYGFPARKFFRDYKDSLNSVDDTAKYWIKAQEKINSDNKLRLFKTHNALGSINNIDFTNNENTCGCIYIVRDPRNVVTSIKDYYEMDTYEEAQDFMFNKKKVLYEETNGKYTNFNFLGSWSTNYKSWIDNKIFPALLVKYEDLEINPLNVLEKIITFVNDVGKLKNQFNRNKAINSINNCSFEVLEKKEKNEGFHEANYGDKTGKKIKFFNRGKKNNWKIILPKKILKEFNNEFYEDLKIFDYEI